ncbi:MAG: hypothetical protein WC994_02760 [Brumimicrobium sp.]
MEELVFGLVRPENDIHTLGISAVGELIEDCGYKVVMGDANVVHSIIHLENINQRSFLKKWIDENSINRIGFSYRLDPKDGQRLFGKFYSFLESEELLLKDGGSIHDVFFAGLPNTTKLIEREYGNEILTFIGDETPFETLIKLNIPKNRIQSQLLEGAKYDTFRLDFAQDLIASGKHNFFKPLSRPTYKNYGSRKDTLAQRIKYQKAHTDLPLTRVHVGPYSENRREAIDEFKNWLKTLSETRFLDIVSIGTSQLSQSKFGEDWGNQPNGGGVPVNSEAEFIEIYEASRPMLIRTYSGTKDTQRMAEVYENTINICWHALSLWWFNKMDGRGPHDVKTNLKNHIETLSIIARHNKPFEPNIPHHFSFRGGDDITYVLSSYLACLVAKKIGIKEMVIQVMLNTPKYTWGVQDLAKARALLSLVRELEDDSFKIYLQPRAGLGYFSPDLEKAKIQLAAVTALMDDIEPNNPKSPEVIHVVSYCEAVELATPTYINESIQITQLAIQEYRKLKTSNLNMMGEINKEVEPRQKYLIETVKSIRQIIEKEIENPYSYEGLYQIFKLGILNAPQLWECRDEFNKAIQFETRLINGSVVLVDKEKQPIDVIEKVRNAFEQL